MNTNGLAKHYDVLTPRERMPLIIAANDRGDDAEAERLVRAAPRNAYRLPDYHGLGDGLTLLALFHALRLLEMAANFWHTSGLASDWAASPSNDRDKEHLRSIERFAGLWAYLFTVEVNGWERLMAELQIDSETLLRDL